MTVDEGKIDEFIEEIERRTGGFVFQKWSDFHLAEIAKYTVEQITAYVFVTDAINFCFWPNNPPGQFEYEHMTRNLEKILN